jgi:hypothetical protein
MEQQVITGVTKNKECGNKVRKCRLGKAQIELEMVLVEMLKEETT